MKSFFDFTRSELTEVTGPHEAAQFFRAVYQDFRDISLPCNLPIVDKTKDSEDGTRRYMLRLADGEVVECVVIPRPERVTFCISSQVGCALACAFCLTGQMGLIRDLSAGEIVSQVLLMRREWMTPHFSVVLMGMGEPLQNYESVLKAIAILHDDHGMKVPMTRITLSTAGLVPAIARLGGELLFPNLSISLTGSTNSVRNELMPINRRYPIEQVIQAVQRLPASRQKRVMFEYVLIKDVTDSTGDAMRLAGLLKGMTAKLNLIPLNSSPFIPFQTPDESVVLYFHKILLNQGITTFIRRNRGNDISAACGQLRRTGEAVS